MEINLTKENTPCTLKKNRTLKEDVNEQGDISSSWIETLNTVKMLKWPRRSADSVQHLSEASWSSVRGRNRQAAVKIHSPSPK